MMLAEGFRCNYLWAAGKADCRGDRGPKQECEPER